MSWRRKEAIEQLLRISRGREFQMVGAATEKPLEPKQVRTRGPISGDANAVISLSATVETKLFHLL